MMRGPPLDTSALIGCARSEALLEDLVQDALLTAREVTLQHTQFVVLAGGGFRGAAVPHAFEALFSGVPHSALHAWRVGLLGCAGTSIGALLAVALAAGAPMAQVHEVPRKLTVSGVLQHVGTARGAGVVSHAALQEVVRSVLSMVGVPHGTTMAGMQARFRRDVHLFAARTHQGQVTLVDFCPAVTPHVRVLDACVASMCIPLLFDPLPAPQNAPPGEYMDGGLLCNFPTHVFPRHATLAVQLGPAQRNAVHDCAAQRAVPSHAFPELPPAALQALGETARDGASQGEGCASPAGRHSTGAEEGACDIREGRTAHSASASGATPAAGLHTAAAPPAQKWSLSQALLTSAQPLLGAAGSAMTLATGMAFAAQTTQGAMRPQGMLLHWHCACSVVGTTSPGPCRHAAAQDVKASGYRQGVGGTPAVAASVAMLVYAALLHCAVGAGLHDATVVPLPVRDATDAAHAARVLRQPRRKPCKSS